MHTHSWQIPRFLEKSCIWLAWLSHLASLAKKRPVVLRSDLCVRVLISVYVGVPTMAISRQLWSMFQCQPHKSAILWQTTQLSMSGNDTLDSLEAGSYLMETPFAGSVCGHVGSSRTNEPQNPCSSCKILEMLIWTHGHKELFWRVLLRASNAAERSQGPSPGLDSVQDPKAKLWTLKSIQTTKVDA